MKEEDVEMMANLESPRDRPAKTPAWARIAAEYAVGDVVRGRVLRVRKKHATVELLPGAPGIVYRDEVDWLSDCPRDIVQAGQVVPVRIISLDPSAGEAKLSIKQARGEPPRRPISDPEGRLFLTGDVAGATESDRELLAHHSEGEKCVAESGRNPKVRKRVKSRRAHDGKLELVGPPAVDTFETEEALVAAVKVKYASLGLDRPLPPMRVHPKFVPQVWELVRCSDLTVDKVLEVCALAASGYQTNALRVHPLRTGPGPHDPQVTRARDGARAWRCSLQNGAPAARRLHFWVIPTAEGNVIEFAGVGVHDDFAIAA